MSRRCKTIPVTIGVLILLYSSLAHADKIDLNTHRERIRLTDDEKVMHQYVLEYIEQEGTIPTGETIEHVLSSPITSDVRAKLSAKLYYENGIIGALFSESESLSMAYLLGLKRGPGTLKQLVSHIHEFSKHTIPSKSIVQSLEFLNAAGYIDVRKNGERVYVIIPKGLKTLYVSSSVKQACSPHESKDSPTFDPTSPPFQEKHSPPVLSEERNFSGTQEEKHSSNIDFDFKNRWEVPLPVPQNIEHVEESKIPPLLPELSQGPKDENEPVFQVIPTFDIPKSSERESVFSGDSTYTLQVAAYRRESDAKRLQQWLRERGYRTRIETVTIPESGPWYRVRFGMYDSYNVTKKTAETFRKQFDFYCWIVPVDS